MLSEASHLKESVPEEGPSEVVEIAPLEFDWHDIENDPAGWDAELTHLRQNVFHRSALLNVHRRPRSFRRGVFIRRGDRIVGALGGLLQPHQSGGLFRSLSFPRGGPEMDADLPRILVDWLLTQGMTRIRLGSYDGGTEAFARDPNGKVEERLEFIYDLTLSEEERLARVNSNHKRKLKQADSARLCLRRIEHWQPWIMTWLNGIWSRRHGHALNAYKRMQMFLFYRKLTRLLCGEKCAGLYGLYDRRNRVMSMAYMLEGEGTSFYMIGASSDEGYRCGASVRLIWELARIYPQVGIRSLNLGGVPVAARDEKHAEFGVYRFKAGFGIEPTLRHTLIIDT